MTASNHQEHIGRLWIKPGITASEEVFLDYNLVTVEWEVNEITIEDKYEIVLTTTFETDVPAAVVVAEPSSVTLPAMEAGDVYNGEFTLTNYGLIRADAISFTMPEDDQFFTYELLGGLPESIAAKGRITVPYRVTCLQSLSQEGDGGGGGSASGFAPTPKEIDGVKCLWDFDPMEWLFEKVRPAKETLQNIIHEVGCSVNTVTREFTDDAIDLSVKVPGGQVSVKRWFYDNEWRWEHTRSNLSFSWDSLGTHIESIDKGGVIYKASSTDANVYTHDIYRIIPKDSGHRWEDKRGNWKEYDDSGRMTSYGTRIGLVGKLLSEAGEDGKLIGIADRNDIQVIWYEDDDGQLLTATVEADANTEAATTTFTYDDAGNVESITDPEGNVTQFLSYDIMGNLLEVRDPREHTWTFAYDDMGRLESQTDPLNNTTAYEYDGANNRTAV